MTTCSGLERYSRSSINVPSRSRKTARCEVCFNGALISPGRADGNKKGGPCRNGFPFRGSSLIFFSHEDGFSNPRHAPGITGSPFLEVLDRPGPGNEPSPISWETGGGFLAEGCRFSR